MSYAGIDPRPSYLAVATVDERGVLVHERNGVPIGDAEPLLEALEGFRSLKTVGEADQIDARLLTRMLSVGLVRERMKLRHEFSPSTLVLSSARGSRPGQTE